MPRIAKSTVPYRRALTATKPQLRTLQIVKEQFEYNPATGEIIKHFKNRPSFVISSLPLRFRGSTPTVIVNGERLHLVSIAWYLYTSDYPSKPPRFINRIKTDYRWENLRYAY